MKYLSRRPELNHLSGVWYDTISQRTSIPDKVEVFHLSHRVFLQIRSLDVTILVYKYTGIGCDGTYSFRIMLLSLNAHVKHGYSEAHFGLVLLLVGQIRRESKK